MAYQEGVATFNGTQDHVDLTWSTHYSSFKNYAGLETTDGSIVGITLTNPSNGAILPDNTGVRVTPSARFSGVVNVLNLQVLP